MKRQYIIPIFVPHLGCPNDCIFCNQKSISGQKNEMTKEKADIIIINIEKPHIKPINNIYSALVYSAVGQDVETSIVDGKIIMENREIIGIDEKMIMDKCQKISDKYFR